MVKSFFRVTRKTVRVRKGTMVQGLSRERGTPVSVFADWRRNSDRTRALLSSLDWVWGLWVKSFYRVTKKTVRVRKGTMAGVGAVHGLSRKRDEVVEF